MKVGLFSCMKNEGPFILEWVAYNLLLGFEKILVYSNDSIDGTTELLDALQGQGVLTHIIQDLQPDQVPQYVAADRAYDHPVLKEMDWLIWLDADEFLFCPKFHNSIKDLAKYTDTFADGLCINWLNFGDSGVQKWSPGLVTERFTFRGPECSSRHVMFKTLFKNSNKVRGFGLHRPFLRAGFNADGRGFVNSTGNAMHDDIYRSGSYKRHALGNAPSTLVAHDVAALFHYAVKSRDCFELKRSRGQGTKPSNDPGRAARFGEKYWRVYNQNAVEDARMIEYTAAIRAKMDHLMQDAATARAHKECNSRYADLLRLNHA